MSDRSNYAYIKMFKSGAQASELSSKSDKFKFFKHKMHSNLIYLKILDAELSLYCHQLDLTN